MICTIQDAIIKLLKADRTQFVGNVSDTTVIKRDSFNPGILDDYPDMRTLVTNSMLLKLNEIMYGFNKEESDSNTLVFDNLAFRELKRIVSKRQASFNRNI